MTDYTHYLSAMVFVPLVGAVIMMLHPEDRGVSSTSSSPSARSLVSAAAWASALFTQFDYDNSGVLQFVADETWIPVIKLDYSSVSTALSLPLIALTLLITPLVHHLHLEPLPRAAQPQGVPHPDPRARRPECSGSFVAQDLILFFVFFELVLLPMYFMIGVWGGPERQYASIKFFLYTLFGSALMIVSFLALFFVAGGDDVRDDRPGRRVWPMNIALSTQVLSLRRHVHGLRHQGADVPVPHLAPRCPHPGAHPGLGHPGRRPAEARHLRLHPGRHSDPARGRASSGPRGSGCSPSSASSTARSAVWPRPT